MEIITIIAIFAAFLLGAFVRKPFCFARKVEAAPELKEHEPEEAVDKEAERMRKQLENLMNAGNPGYKQQQLEE